MNKKLDVELDRFLIANLERERCILGDESVGVTLVRRIEIGNELICGGAAEELYWRPLRRETKLLSVDVPQLLAEDLAAAANAVGYDEQVVLAAYAGSDACKPYDVLLAERQYQASQRRHRDTKILRTEVGRGNIYEASFELPGYQLSFLSLLGRGRLSQSAVIEEALLALAREACVTNAVRDVPLSHEARAFADRMIALSKLRPAAG